MNLLSIQIGKEPALWDKVWSDKHQSLGSRRIVADRWQTKKLLRTTSMKNTCHCVFKTRPQLKNKVLWWEYFSDLWCKLKTTPLPLSIWKDHFPLFPLSEFTASMTTCSLFTKLLRNIWLHRPSTKGSGFTPLCIPATNPWWQILFCNTDNYQKWSKREDNIPIPGGF